MSGGRPASVDGPLLARKGDAVPAIPDQSPLVFQLDHHQAELHSRPRAQDGKKNASADITRRVKSRLRLVSARNGEKSSRMRWTAVIVGALFVGAAIWRSENSLPVTAVVSPASVAVAGTSSCPSTTARGRSSHNTRSTVGECRAAGVGGIAVSETSDDEVKLSKWLIPLLPVTPDVDRPSTFQARFSDRAGECAGALDLRKLVECCQASWRAGIRPRLRRIGGRAVAGARPAGIRRVVRRCRGSRRVAGACRCRAGCRKPLRCGGGVPAEHELVEVAAQMGAAQAMEGSERPALQVREHTMDPRQHEMGGRCTDDLGLVVVVGQAAITAPAIGNHPRARRRGPGNEGTKAARGEIPDRRQPDAAWLALGR